MEAEQGKTKESSRRVNLEVLTASALTGLALFPLLGNVLALLTGLPRRPLQFGLLALFLGLCVFGLGHLYSYRAFASRRIGGRALIVYLLAMALTGAYVVAAVANGAIPTLYAWFSAFITSVWLAVVVFNALPWRGCNETAEGARATSTGTQFDWVLCLLLAGIVLTAYVKGPVRAGEALMAFGGSQILVGTSSAILAGLALVSLRSWYKTVAILCAVYLCFISTSRAGLLIFIVLCTSVVVSRAMSGEEPSRGATRTRTIQDVLLLLACIVVVVAPVALGGRYYPYLYNVVETGSQRAHVRQELSARYSRLMRLFPNELSTEGLRNSDARWKILLDSTNVVEDQVWGYWPQEFQAVAGTSCGPKETCRYPHNLLLEIGFNFGWIPLALMGFGLLYWGLRVLQSVVPPHPLPARISGVGFLGYLFFAQVSGNLFDHTLALLLGTFWMATQVLPRKGVRDAHQGVEP